MKKIYFILIISLIFLSNNYAQKLSDIANINKKNGWIYFKQNLNINPQKVFETNKKAFGLTQDYQMRVVKTENDNLGYSHCRYQQYYKGIQIEGCQYIIHSINNKSKIGNGKILNNLNINTLPVITFQQAIDIAIKSVPAQKYMWQDNNEEQILKQIKNDKNSTYYPKPQLIIYDKSYSENYKLAYKVEIYAKKPLKREFVYIDANNGEILNMVNMIQTTDVPGVAVTKYSGTQNIITDSVSPNQYRLIENSRGSGNGVKTYNMQTGTDYSLAVNFTDSDNYWNNVNTQKDEYATDAHWGAEMTYDYYFQTFNRNSYDNLGAALVSFVHYDVNYDNAYWDGTRMTYGDGSTFKPFVALDVCGHEITHAVTEKTCNLTYQNESGALNEAFSDIFSTAIERYARPLNWDWIIGKDIDPTGAGLRSMSDPKAGQNPDTYLGTYWVTGTTDNGGVHTNSGVANYWFYLLSVGDTGTNDNNVVYNVTGIGIDKAIAIAYRTLSVYLINSSDYYATREASIQAAEDLYGACSDELKQTANAWYAVGVGQPIADNDISLLNIISPVTSCGLTNEYVSIQIKYNGCNLPLFAGDTIKVSYKLDNTTVVDDTLVLASNVNGGDTINFTFSTSCNASTVGVHTINSWAKLSTDTINSNDTLNGYQFTNKLQQNIDFGVISIDSPVSGCQLSNAENVIIKVQFYGCDSILAGDSIPVAYKIGTGTEVWDTIILSSTIYADGIIYHTFSTPANLSNPATYTFSSWTKYRFDSLTTNDKYSNYKVKNPAMVNKNHLTFENYSKVLDSLLITKNICSGALVSTVSHNTGLRGFQMTGGNVMAYMDSIVMPDGTNNWLVNDILKAKANFCVDATNWKTAYMRFDLKQTFSMTLKLYTGTDFPDESSLRILVNDNWIGGTYTPSTYYSDPFKTYLINLNNFAGQDMNICFNSMCAFNLASDPTTTMGSKGDNAYIDNVWLFEAPVATDDFDSTAINTADTVNILINDTNYNVSVLKDSIIGQPANGNAVIVNDSIIYTPNTGYFGKDTIICKVCYNDYPSVCDTSKLIITVGSNQGIEDLQDYFNLNIYPNPNNGVFNIDYTSSKQEKITIEITDLIGQTVYSKDNNVINGVNKYNIDISTLQQGIYVIKIYNSSEIITKKIIKQ